MNKSNFLYSNNSNEILFLFLGINHRIINYKNLKAVKIYCLGVYEITNKNVCVENEVNNPSDFKIYFI